MLHTQPQEPNTEGMGANSKREIKTRSKLQKDTKKLVPNIREESNGLRQNMGKTSKGKIAEDLNTNSKISKKSRKIKKNNQIAVK